MEASLDPEKTTRSSEESATDVMERRCPRENARTSETSTSGRPAYWRDREREREREERENDRERTKKREREVR
jgi:hypothetical protein